MAWWLTCSKPFPSFSNRYNHPGTDSAKALLPRSAVGGLRMYLGFSSISRVLSATGREAVIS
ncbi:hypothetical protein D9M70_192770 [compost metagenome]